MIHLAALGVAWLPFLFLFGPPMVANVAAFAFWAFWIAAVVSCLAVLNDAVKPARDPSPRLVRILYRWVAWSGLVALAAFGHYAMAAVLFVGLMLAQLSQARLKDAGNVTEESA